MTQFWLSPPRPREGCQRGLLPAVHRPTSPAADEPGTYREQVTAVCLFLDCGDLQTLRAFIRRRSVDLSPWPARRLELAMADGSGDRLLAALQDKKETLTKINQF